MIVEQAEKKTLLRVLSLLLAVLIFLFVFCETEGEQTINVPVDYINLPVDLIVEPPPPAAIGMVISGPRILLAKTRLTGITLRLDLHGASPGTNRFADLEQFVRLDQQVRAKSALPVLEINLRKKY